MMLECDPVEVIDRQLAAYQALDLAGFVAMYAPDAVVSRFPGQAVMTGHEELRVGYAAAFQNRPYTLTLGERIVNGQFVIDEEIVAVDGAEVTRVILVYEVQGCLIARSWMLPDPLEAE